MFRSLQRYLRWTYGAVTLSEQIVQYENKEEGSITWRDFLATAQPFIAKIKDDDAILKSNVSSSTLAAPVSATTSTNIVTPTAATKTVAAPTNVLPQLDASLSTTTPEPSAAATIPTPATTIVPPKPQRSTNPTVNSDVIKALEGPSMKSIPPQKSSPTPPMPTTIPAAITENQEAFETIDLNDQVTPALPSTNTPHPAPLSTNTTTTNQHNDDNIINPYQQSFRSSSDPSIVTIPKPAKPERSLSFKSYTTTSSHRPELTSKPLTLDTSTAPPPPPPAAAAPGQSFNDSPTTTLKKKRSFIDSVKAVFSFSRGNSPTASNKNSPTPSPVGTPGKPNPAASTSTGVDAAGASTEGSKGGGWKVLSDSGNKKVPASENNTSPIPTTKTDALYSRADPEWIEPSAAKPPRPDRRQSKTNAFTQSLDGVATPKQRAYDPSEDRESPPDRFDALSYHPPRLDLSTDDSVLMGSRPPPTIFLARAQSDSMIKTNISRSESTLSPRRRSLHQYQSTARSSLGFLTPRSGSPSPSKPSFLEKYGASVHKNGLDRSDWKDGTGIAAKLRASVLGMTTPSAASPRSPTRFTLQYPNFDSETSFYSDNGDFSTRHSLEGLRTPTKGTILTRQSSSSPFRKSTQSLYQSQLLYQGQLGEEDTVQKLKDAIVRAQERSIDEDLVTFNPYSGLLEIPMDTSHLDVTSDSIDMSTNQSFSAPVPEAGTWEYFHNRRVYPYCLSKEKIESRRAQVLQELGQVLPTRNKLPFLHSGAFSAESPLLEHYQMIKTDDKELSPYRLPTSSSSSSSAKPTVNTDLPALYGGLPLPDIHTPSILTNLDRRSGIAYCGFVERKTGKGYFTQRYLVLYGDRSSLSDVNNKGAQSAPNSQIPLTAPCLCLYNTAVTSNWGTIPILLKSCILLSDLIDVTFEDPKNTSKFQFTILASKSFNPTDAKDGKAPTRRFSFTSSPGGGGGSAGNGSKKDGSPIRLLLAAPSALDRLTWIQWIQAAKNRPPPVHSPAGGNTNLKSGQQGSVRGGEVGSSVGGGVGVTGDKKVEYKYLTKNNTTTAITSN